MEYETAETVVTVNIHELRQKTIHFLTLKLDKGYRYG